MKLKSINDKNQLAKLSRYEVITSKPISQMELKTKG